MPLRLTALLLASAASSTLVGQSLIPFTEEAIERGLVYTVNFPQMNGLYGFGCGFVDLDGDGDADILTLGGSPSLVGVFENLGNGTFVDRTATAGITGITKPSAFAAGDLNNDGRIDLYISQIDQPNRIFRGLAPGPNGPTFGSVTAPAVAVNGACKAVSLADFDNDGDLDIFAPVYRNGSPGSVGKPHSLFRNDGAFQFVDVAASNGLTKPAYTFLGVWTDIDLDGDVDLYLSNDRGHLQPFFQGNQLFRNDNGQLVEISAGSGANVQLFSMGVGVGDFDRNGYPDFYCTNIANVNQPTLGQNPLLLNQGNNTFVRGDQLWGVGSFTTSWGAEMFDLDNDGALDLYVNNQFGSNSFFRGAQVPPATSITLIAGAPGGETGYSYASCSADVDGDGDEDLLVGDVGVNNMLYINHEGELRNSVRIAVVGKGGNRTSIGATLLARRDPNGPVQFHDIHSGGRSYLGNNLPIAHIGLDQRTTLHEVTVRWPLGIDGGPTRVIRNLPAQGQWKVYPPSLLGDVDGDGQLTAIDRVTLTTCMARGFQSGCEIMDFDGDSDIDGDDDFLFTKRASDFNLDGVVGPADLAVMLGVWGTPNQLCDLSGDGLVGSDDIAVLLGVWG